MKPRKRNHMCRYDWPMLEVKPSSETGGGNGVFAVETLMPGTMIPILGKPMSENSVRKRIEENTFTHGYQYQWIFNKKGVDGHPRENKFQNVGTFGLAIAMMINESSSNKAPSCIFKMDHVVVAKRIAKGQELTLYYGSAYETIRKRLGYTVKCDSGYHYKALENVRYPNSKTRKDNYDELFEIIKVCERNKHKEHKAKSPKTKKNGEHKEHKKHKEHKAKSPKTTKNGEHKEYTSIRLNKNLKIIETIMRGSKRKVASGKWWKCKHCKNQEQAMQNFIRKNSHLCPKESKT